jgi:hypothetical protein
VTHVAPRGVARMVRVIAGEIELRAARRGQSVVLHAEDLDAIAESVLQLAVMPGEVGLVDARAMAAELGVGRDWVYANADRLGAIRLGDGPRARLRFDPARAHEVLAAAVVAEKKLLEATPESRRRARPRRETPPDIRLIEGRRTRR